jgi:hypothetical protein
VQIEKLAETSFPSFSVRKLNRYINLTLSFIAFYSNCHSEVGCRSEKSKRKKKEKGNAPHLSQGLRSESEPEVSGRQRRMGRRAS